LDALRNAYIAAVAEPLARCDGLKIPGLAETQGLDLPKSFFAGKLESAKSTVGGRRPDRVPAPDFVR